MVTIIRLFMAALGMLILSWGPGQAAAAGDATAGANGFGLCAACHSLRPGVNMTGPSLAGILGRNAGSLTNFRRYSAALAGSGVIWDEQNLDAWLADPAGFIPGNRMTIRGIPDGKMRADIIAVLRLAAPDGPIGAAASAPEASEPDLKSQPPARQVRAIGLCGDRYRVTMADGSTAEFWERNLRFKTDQSTRGPKSSAPIIMPAGMQGDRASVIFAAPQEISDLIRGDC